MKKSNIYLAILLASFAVITGCVKEKDLEQVDPNVMTSASFWKTAEDAVAGLNAVYGKLCEDGTYMRSTPLMLDLRSDDSRSNSPWTAMYNVGRFTCSLTDPAIYGWAYESSYHGIYRCNQVLQNVPDIDMDQDLKNRVLGQAYFLRGFYLFHMVNMFKNVPIPLTIDELYHPQKTQAEGWAQVIADLTQAVDLLPWSYDDVEGIDAGQKGRATKGSALGYLGKAYLFTREYQSAANAFLEIINSGRYSLMPNYRDNFTEEFEDNAESLFEVQFNREVGGVDLSWCCDPLPGWGRTSARAITYAPRGFGWTDVQPTWTLFNDYHIEQTNGGDVDPRLDVTMFYNKPGVMLYGQVFSDYYAANPADLNDLFCRKYQNDTTRPDEFDWRSGINERLLRYADVLLMYAECLNELNKTADAYQFIQEVRDRVDLPDLSVTKPNMTQQEMRDQIAHERFLEFSLEGHRFDDIRRWGWLEDPAKLAWLKSRDPEFESYVPGREYFPIPQYEVDNNPGTQQNTGW